MTNKLPDYQDEVRHVDGEVSGTVIATYELDHLDYETNTVLRKKHLDVRGDNDKIYYAVLADKWVVTRTREEIEGVVADD